MIIILCQHTSYIKYSQVYDIKKYYGVIRIPIFVIITVNMKILNLVGYFGLSPYFVHILSYHS